MMTEPLVSVLILNYNGVQDLKECFDSLYNLNYRNIELILIDNASNDNSVKFVQENYPNVKIIELMKNYGFAQGNNFGAKIAKGKYLVLLNNDTVVNVNWLSELVNIAESSNNIGIVGNKIYYYDDKKTINFAGGLCNKIGKTSHIGFNQLDDQQFNYKRRSFFICGASLLFKREIYEKIKLFDPKYFIYFEDVDFCWRTWMLGYEVIYTPNTYIYHKIGRVIRSNKRKKFLLEKNRLRTLLKNYEKKSLRRIIPQYYFNMIFEILKYRKYNSKASCQRFLTLIKATTWNIIHLKSLIANRKLIQTYRRKDDNFIFRLMNDLKERAQN